MLKKVFVFIFCMGMFLANVAYSNSFNMTYIYGGTTDNIINRIDKADSIINEVSPSYFDLNSDGSLKKSDSFNEELIIQMHNRNIKVVPFLSNHWNRDIGKAALNNREKLVIEIISMINKYNLDGINVDIENVTEKERDAYTDFVKLLSEQLPEEKVLAVAVAANPKGYTIGWHGSYDYLKLGEYADYLMLMTYDEHYEGGSSGPVASYSFVEESIQYALKYVDSKKIVVGLAFYARYWNNEDGDMYTGRAVSLSTMREIFDKYLEQESYQPMTGSMIGFINVDSVQAENDNYIFPAGRYRFYYDNVDTMKKKIDLVDKYNLKGTGSWALGQETDDIWNAWKEEIIFNDVSNANWSKKYIMYTYNTNLMIGKEEKVFGITDNLTRAETVTVLTRLLEFRNFQITESNTNLSFVDVDNHWSKEAVYKCVNLGLIIGYGDGTFRPDDPITREEIATIISRMNIYINVINNNSIKFIDVDKSQWSYDNIMGVAKMGFVNGYEDNTFKPKNNITREEMATIMYKICNI